MKNKNKMKKLFALFLFLFVVVSSLALTTMALPKIQWMNVYVNGQLIDSNNIFGIERGTTATIRVVFETTNIFTVPNEGNGETNLVTVRAWIDGYRERIEDETERFDLFSGRTYTKTLLLSLPSDMEEGQYTLHVMVSGTQSVPGESYKEYTIAIQRRAYEADILSVDFALPAEVNAGESITATAVIKNRGSHKLEDVFLKAEIPELNISKTMYLGDLYPYDYQDNTERDTKTVTFSLEVPEATQSGTYTLKIIAYNSEVSKEIEKTFNVIGRTEEQQPAELVNVVAIESEKEVMQGNTVRYQLIITNMGDTTKTLQLNVLGVEAWATANLNKQIITIAPKSTGVVEVTLNVDENALIGSHVFTVQVLEESNVVATKNLIAKVIEGKKVKSEIWIWVVVAILAVIAIILLVSLIVILTKKGRGVEEKPEEIYY